MIIKINAIVREEKFEDVKEALNKIGVNGITVSQVMGCGAQKGLTEVVRGTNCGIFGRMGRENNSCNSKSSVYWRSWRRKDF